MRVTPRRYAFCFECSEITDDGVERVQTVQWLREVVVPQGRGGWGPRHPRSKYVCSQCGTENY